MFELHITCSKDIDSLHIDFSDGTSVVTSKSDNNAPREKSQKTKKESKIPFTESNERTQEEYLDTDIDFSENISKEIIQKPIIEETNRDKKVANELQNLDI